jgi:sodium/hydrogen antiporter
VEPADEALALTRPAAMRAPRSGQLVDRDDRYRVHHHLLATGGPHCGRPGFGPGTNPAGPAGLPDGARLPTVDLPDLAVIALFVVAYGLVSGWVVRSVVTGPMLFVGFGLLIGPEALDLVDVPIADEGVELLAETTLGLLLFADAVRIDLAKLRVQAALPARMLLVGLPLAVAVGAVVAAPVLGLPAAVALLVAAVLAPTDAALGQAVVTNPSLPTRVRQSLNVESGLNDGLAVPFVAVATFLAVREEEGRSAAGWARFAAEQIGYGTLVGLAVGLGGGLLVARASARGLMEGTYRQIAVLGLAVLAFVLADQVGGNGFIATFAGGLAFGAAARDACAHVEEFTEDVAQLLMMLSFVVFGAILVGPALEALDWRIALYTAASLLVVRPLAIAVSLVGAGLAPRTVGFFGWFGPRGLASIIFGLQAVAAGEEAGTPELEVVGVVVSWTVLVSIVAHGLSATPAAAAYGRWWAAMREEQDAGAMPEAEHMPEQRIRRGRWGL